MRSKQDLMIFPNMGMFTFDFASIQKGQPGNRLQSSLTLSVAKGKPEVYYVMMITAGKLFTVEKTRCFASPSEPE